MLNYIIPEFKKQNDLQKVNVCILSDGEGCAIGYGHEIYLDHKDEYVVRPRRIDYYHPFFVIVRLVSLMKRLNMTTSPTLSFSKFVIVTLM